MHTQSDEAELPAALAPDRQEVGDLAGMDRLANQLDGWAHNALVAPKPQKTSSLTRRCGRAWGSVALESVQGTELEVKPVAVHEPATPDKEANKKALPSEAEGNPGPYTRLVAVELTILNVGNATYDGPVFGGAHLIVDDEPTGASPTVQVTECNKLSDLTLGPGDRTSGRFVFAKPGDAEMGDFEMALDAGRSDETGVWQLEPLELP